jgi:hypothetical protein
MKLVHVDQGDNFQHGDRIQDMKHSKVVSNDNNTNLLLKKLGMSHMTRPETWIFRIYATPIGGLLDSLCSNNL